MNKAQQANSIIFKKLLFLNDIFLNNFSSFYKKSNVNK